MFFCITYLQILLGHCPYNWPKIGEYFSRNLVLILLYSLLVINPSFRIDLIILILDWYSFSASNCSGVIDKISFLGFKSIVYVAFVAPVFSVFVVETFKFFITIFANMNF